MLILNQLNTPVPDPIADARAALVRALDMDELWCACATLLCEALPCQSCSLMFDIDGYEPRQGRHILVDAKDAPLPATSLTIAAPYLASNPRIRSYTYSQIVSADALAPVRLHMQNPRPAWGEFIHLAFWTGQQLNAVLSIRIHVAHLPLSERALGLLDDLYQILNASLQRVQQLESERIGHKAAQALMGVLPQAVGVIDNCLTPIFLTAGATQICARYRSDGETNASSLPQAIEQGIRTALLLADDRLSGDPEDVERGFVLDHPALEQRIQVKIRPLPGLATHYLLTFTSADVDSGGLPVDTQSHLDRLSPREREIAMLVARGMRNDEIARQLGRSRRTVECQVGSIYRKLGLSNRAQLTLLLAT